MSNNTQKNPDQLKIYNSPVYRKKIKRMVEMVKTGYGIHSRLPRGPLPALKGTATSKEKEARAKRESHRLTLATVHYFALPLHNNGSVSSKATSSNSGDQTSETNELQSVP